MIPTILIDGDILTYRVGFSVESSVHVVDNIAYKRKGYAEKAAKEKGMEIHSRKNIGTIKELLRNLNVTMTTMFYDIGSKKYKMFLTDSKLAVNFRTQLATLETYKGNRSAASKPFYYDKIREILVDKFNAELISGQEADDALGIAQYEAAAKYKSFDSTVIASIDKDLRVLEGNHYHMVNRSLQYVSKEDALKNFCRQFLTGDRVDCIPGIPKILKIKGDTESANKLIYGHYLAKYNAMALDSTPKQCYDYVVDLYAKYGLTGADLQEVQDLVWIRRNPDENFSDWVKVNPDFWDAEFKGSP